MASKLKIPRAAMPVVKVLRRDVERPGELPVGDPDLSGGLSWQRRHPNFPDCGPGGCCPMGLHPKSADFQPEWDDVDPEDQDRECSNFPAPNRAVQSFAEWWDSLSGDQAAEAVEAVWPTKKGRAKRG